MKSHNSFSCIFTYCELYTYTDINLPISSLHLLLIIEYRNICSTKMKIFGKKYHFNHFVIIRKTSMQKIHISTREVARNNMPDIFPSNSVVGQGISMLRQQPHPTA